MGVAVGRRYMVNYEWKEDVSFFNVTAWGTLGENVAQSLDKGIRVIVTGRLEQRKYQAQDGSDRTVVEIVADEIGPSLRWATAEVTKVTRDDGSNRNTSQRNTRDDDSAGTYGRRTADPVYDDAEEPFVDLEVRRMDFRNMALTEPWM